MQVTLKRTEKTEGFFKKKAVFELNLSVQFSPVELEAIKRAGINEHLLVEHDFADLTKKDGLPLRELLVKNLYKRNGEPKNQQFIHYDIIESTTNEQEIRENLGYLKTAIEAQIENGGDSTETFEL